MKKFTKRGSLGLISWLSNITQRIDDFRLVFSPTTFILVVVIVFRISYNSGWYKGKDYTLETVAEIQKRKFNMKYDCPEVEKDADIWRQIGIDHGFWNEKYQERFENIIFYVKEAHNMGYSVNENGEKTFPIAYTTYQIYGDELYPDEIVLSNATYFDSVGRSYVVAHEMGHAVLLLEDEYEDDSIIMWSKTKDNYTAYGNIYYFVDKVKEQYQQKPNKEHLKYLFDAVKESKESKENLSIRVYLMSDMSHKIVLVQKDK